MVDGQGRKINYLRLSVTDRCNLRCQYCMPKNGVKWTKHENILSYEEFLRLCIIMADLGVEKIKITGGEPLVRKGLCDFIKKLRKINGIKEVTLTTNGVLLKDMCKELYSSGIDSVNISLDTLSKKQYQDITGFDFLDDVLCAVTEAEKVFDKVKINCVPMRATSKKDLIDLAYFAKDKNIDVRFIEIMPIGLGQNFEPISNDLVLNELENIFGEAKLIKEKRGNGPAVYYSFNGFKGSIGFISALSHKFCNECNRIRLTSTGELKLCLFDKSSLDLKSLLRSNADDNFIKNEILLALNKKPQGHCVEENIKNENKKMYQIGG